MASATTDFAFSGIKGNHLTLEAGRSQHSASGNFSAAARRYSHSSQTDGNGTGSRRPSTSGRRPSFNVSRRRGSNSSQSGMGQRRSSRGSHSSSGRRGSGSRLMGGGTGAGVALGVSGRSQSPARRPSASRRGSGASRASGNGSPPLASTASARLMMSPLNNKGKSGANKIPPIAPTGPVPSFRTPSSSGIASVTPQRNVEPASPDGGKAVSPIVAPRSKPVSAPQPSAGAGGGAGAGSTSSTRVQASAASKPRDTKQVAPTPIKKAAAGGQEASGARAANGSADTKRPTPVKRLPALDQLKQDSKVPEAPKSPLAKIGDFLSKGKTLLRFGKHSKTTTARRRRSSAAHKGHKKGIHENHALNISLRCIAVHKGQVWGSTRDGRLQVFNAETGAVISTVDVPDTTFIWCIASVGSYVWCGTETGTILLYHGRRKKLVKKCKMHSGGVYALVTNRIMLPQAGESNPLLALARQLESSRSVIDRVTKANVPEHDVSHSPLRLPHGSGKDVLEEHTSYVDAASAAEVQTAPTDEGLPTQLVWSASADFTIVAWDVRGRFVQSYTGHSNQVRSLCIVGGHLWSGSDDNTIRVWDVTRANKCLATLTGHAKGVVSLAHVTRDVWKPDASESGVFSAASMSQMLSPASTANNGADAPGGDMSTSVVSGCMDGTIRVWNSVTFECIKEVPAVEGRVAQSLVMGDNQVWCGDASGTIHVLSAKDDFKVIKTLDAHQKFLSGMVSVQRRETRVVWSFSAGEANTKVWTQTFDVSQQVDPEEYLAEICQLQQELARMRASLAQQLSADASTLNSAQGDLAATKAKLRAEQDAHQATREERNKLKRALAQRMKGTAATGVQAGETGAELDARAAAAVAEMKLLKASVISPDTDQGQELIKLRQSVVQKDNRIEELETLLASTQAKLHKTSTDLAHECRLSLKMQTRLNAMDETKLHSLETMLSDAQYELQDKIRALAALQEKYDALDVFKLDKIARRLDGLRTVIGKAEYTQSQFDVSELQSAGDRQIVGGAMTNIREHLLSCKREVADVINECLTGTLKFHIGAPADGDGALAGPDYEAVMNAGGAAQYAAAHGVHTPPQKSMHRRRRSGERLMDHYDSAKARVKDADDPREHKRRLSATFSRQENLMLPNTGDLDDDSYR